MAWGTQTNLRRHAALAVPSAECRLAETGALNGAGPGRLVPLDETVPPSRSGAINYPSYRVAARGVAPLSLLPGRDVAVRAWPAASGKLCRLSELSTE